MIRTHAHTLATRFPTGTLRRCVGWILLFMTINGLSIRVPAQAPTTNQANLAQISIRGYGFMGNRKLKKVLDLLQTGRTRPVAYEETFVEDAALVLQSKLILDGYLRPRLTIFMTLTDGRTLQETWSHEEEPEMTEDLSIKKLDIQVEKGVFYYYDKLEFEGLTVLEIKKAEDYFIDSGFLFPMKSYRRYSPAQLRQSLISLREVMIRRGYGSVQVNPKNLSINHDTGEVEVTIELKEGPLTLVRSVKLDGLPDSMQTAEDQGFVPGEPYSSYWLQNYLQRRTTLIYQKGYPDASMSLTNIQQHKGATNLWVDLQIVAEKGPLVRVGQTRFEGLEKTKPKTLRRQLTLEPGELLDRTRAEHDRHKLAALGIFRSVYLDYTEVDDSTRDVVYEASESRTVDLSLLFGYGSYELLRAGFELERRNLFGVAHQARLRALQSFKASSVDFRYSIPRAFGTPANLFFNASALIREETSFRREEWGGSVGVQRFIPAIKSDGGVRYNYALLEANDADAEISGRVERARVGSVILDLKHDGRDNPLVPRKGFKMNGSLELAGQELGGQVNFERVEIGASYHFSLSESLTVHLGLLHGLAFTLTSDRDDLPFNKRFFPGGENSVRGFKQGEASPRDADNNIIGAETYLQGNLELEQTLTRSWSVVGFLDSVIMSEEMSDYPSDEDLYSAGIGIRWKTIIGPARLEYGHNLNPRDKDPDGTLHFSIGFPF